MGRSAASLFEEKRCFKRFITMATNLISLTLKISLLLLSLTNVRAQFGWGYAQYFPRFGGQNFGGQNFIGLNYAGSSQATASGSTPGPRHWSDSAVHTSVNHDGRGLTAS